MIQVKKRIKGIWMNEYWFAKNIFKLDVFKIVAYRNYLGRAHPLMCKHVSYTLETDLSRNEEDLFNSFKSNAKNKIRKTETLNFRWGVDDISIDEYIAFFNAFARTKGFSPENKSRLNSYNKENILFITARDGLTSELLVVHVYLVDGERARSLHSVSQIHDMKDDEKRKRVGFFNKRLHWEGMKYFKNLGYSIYDWGGFSHKYDDKVLMGINEFKKSFGGIEREVVNYNSVLRELVEIVSRIKRKL
jgi:hypothetical protein